MRTETKTRSIVKAMTWRLLATITTFFLVLIFTGKINVAISVGVLEIIIKTIIYYAHERTWNVLKWGLKDE